MLEDDHVVAEDLMANQELSAEEMEALQDADPSATLVVFGPKDGAIIFREGSDPELVLPTYEEGDDASSVMMEIALVKAFLNCPELKKAAYDHFAAEVHAPVGSFVQKKVEGKPS